MNRVAARWRDDLAGSSWLERKGLDAGFLQAAVIFNYPFTPASEARLLLPSLLSGVCNVCEIKAEEAPS